MQLSKISYYQTGGTCLAFFEPSSVEDLQAARREIAQRNIPFFILGAGSNSLVTDEPWPGAVIALHRMTPITAQGHNLICGAGVINSDLAAKALELGLSGIGWMNGLPGQIGGTVRMNARCYGGEIGDVVTSVTTVDARGDIKTYDARQSPVFRGYKDTIFMTNDEVIAAATFSLHPGDPVATKQLMDSCYQDRFSKAQFTHPSCGCVFKNRHDPDISVPSGMLLDRAGAKGMSLNGAVVSAAHSNFVFNQGASSNDILQLTFAMREKVFTAFGVWLEYEMEVLGAMPYNVRAKFLEKRTEKLNVAGLAQLRSEFTKRRSS